MNITITLRKNFASRIFGALANLIGKTGVVKGSKEATDHLRQQILANVNPVVYAVYTPKVYKRTYDLGRNYFVSLQQLKDEARISVENLVESPRTLARYAGFVEQGLGPGRVNSISTLIEEVESRMGDSQDIPPLRFSGIYGFGKMPPRPLMVAGMVATKNFLIKNRFPKIFETAITSQVGLESTQTVTLRGFGR